LPVSHVKWTVSSVRWWVRGIGATSRLGDGATLRDGAGPGNDSVAPTALTP
jgi:hypothetical protein